MDNEHLKQIIDLNNKFVTSNEMSLIQDICFKLHKIFTILDDLPTHGIISRTILQKIGVIFWKFISTLLFFK